MNRRAFSLALISLALVAPTARAADRHVVVISIDGLPGSYLSDPKVSLPVIRGLASAGVAAKEGMVVSNPSVTWPNHTTMMTGVHPERHGVLANGVIERSAGKALPVKVVPGKTQAELVRVPLLFDLMKEKGLTSAAINWPCTAGSTSIADNLPDVPNALQYTNQGLKDALAKKGLLARFNGGSATVRDEIWTEAACGIIRETKPSLLVLHLLNLDGTHHRYGPDTSPGYTASALMDAHVGQVLRALDDAGIRDKTTVFVVSDHGFINIPKSINTTFLLKRAGLIPAEGPGRVQVISEGGTALVYFASEATDADRAATRKLFGGAEGIASVIEPADYARYGLPKPSDHPGSPDLFIAAKEGYDFGGGKGETAIVENPNGRGSHGFLMSEPKMRATFVASGAGIKTGTELRTVNNIDLAPTIAKILGVPLKDVSGRVLSEILED